MYDYHIHTHNSHDSKQTLDEICKAALEKGLEGIAITDHADAWFYARENTNDRILACIADVNKAKEKYGDKLDIMQGIEMAEYLYDPENSEKIMNLTDYDVILGSVHCLYYEDWTDGYSRLDFSTEATSIDKLKGFICEYFNKVYEMAKKTDFDVLSHLTCPLRYINGKYGRNIDSTEFKSEIEKILDLIIQRDISLEVNTSGVGYELNSTMPDSNIIKLYRDLGGKMVTLGSDAHIPNRIANGFNYAVSELKKIGFDEYYIFKNRKPIAHKLSHFM